VVNAVNTEVPGADHERRTFWLRTGDQSVLVVLFTLALLLLAVTWSWRGGWQGRLVDVDRAEGWDYEFQIDVNRADWPELALLPGVGEKLAQRIVAYRGRHGPFTDLADLRRVHGIGPRTLANIRPYLLAPGNEPALRVEPAP
jgi:competence protein ComEA